MLIIQILGAATFLFLCLLITASLTTFVMLVIVCALIGPKETIRLKKHIKKNVDISFTTRHDKH